MGVMDALSCEIFVKCQQLYADVTLNCCEQKSYHFEACICMGEPLPYA
jgi:hypothetical protein